jgi:histidinol-phosphatase
MLLAEGSVDVVAEHRLKVFDIAALVQIIEQSGGKISNLHGDHTETSSSALVTNKVLHGKLRDLFQAAG